MSMESPHYSNFSKTHVITKTDRELPEDGSNIQKESNDNLGKNVFARAGQKKKEEEVYCVHT